MKEKPKKQFTELSDQELEKVNGGMFAIVVGAGIPEECKDPEYRCSHVQVCKLACAAITD